MMTDLEWRQFKAEKFNSLPSRNRAVSVLEKLVTNWEGEGDWDYLVEKINKNPDRWEPPGFHFSMGMGIRNYLREKGLTENTIGIDNWDDYYIPVLEYALHKVYGFEFPWFSSIS